VAGSVPGGQHRIANASGHYLQYDEPDVVLDAIHRVVRRVQG
jgi:hypothetical protein